MGLTYTKETGESRFQFTNKEGVRDSIYLGRMSKREAEHHATFLKKLVASHLSQSVAIDRQTAAYLEELPKRIKKSLIAKGLYQPTTEETKSLSLSVGELTEKFLDFHKEDKSNTYKNIKLACDKLLDRFGAAKKILDITPTEINHFEKYLYREFAEATASRLIKRFRQIMSWGIGQGFFKENIFRSMWVGKQENKGRLEYVPVEKLQLAMDACVGFELRLALFLARFAAFRTPSECNLWLWRYINFESKRVKVWDVKRKCIRIIPLFGPTALVNMYPIFAELLFEKGCESFLLDLKQKKIDLKESLRDWETHGLAIENLLESNGNGYIAEMSSRFPKDKDFVFSPEFRKRKSRGWQMEKLMKKSKVTWQKDFQNLRASCESEWIRDYGIHSATEWTGNSIEVAQRHYCMITPDIWAKATGRTVSEDKIRETLQSLVKSFGLEKIKTALDEIADRGDK